MDFYNERGYPPKKKKTPKIAGILLILLSVTIGFLLSSFLLGNSRVMELFGIPSKSSSAIELMSEPPLENPAELIPYYDLRYFIQQLDEESLADFCAIYRSITEHKDWCRLPYPVEQNKFDDLFKLFHYECPELFQADYSGWKYELSKDKQTVINVCIGYQMTKEEYAKKKQECLSRISALSEQTKRMSEAEKEKYVYDWFVKNTIYASDTENAGDSYGFLVNNAAKCDGISLGLKWTMEELGISCLCVAGKSEEDTVGHAWNIIRIDNRYYDLDLTAAISADHSETPIYKAYNVSDQWVRENYPLFEEFFRYGDLPGNSDMNGSYHVQNGTFVAAGEDYLPILYRCLAQISNGDNVFELQFENQQEFDRMLEGMNDAVLQWFYQNGKQHNGMQYYYSSDYRTIRVILKNVF